MDFNLIEKNFPEVKRFTISKLAGILYDCVEWKGEGSRQDTDWLTAEEYTNHIGDNWIKNLTSKYLILSVYSKLREEDQSLPEISRNVINKFSEGYEELKKIGVSVLNLPNEKITSLIQSINKEQAKGNQDLFLGRDVWGMYQHMKNTDFLFTKDYGRIRFS